MLETFLRETLLRALEDASRSDPSFQGIQELPQGFKLSPPPREQPGDYATNLAFLLSRPLRRPPREVAEVLAASLGKQRGIARVVVAGGGFLNIVLSRELFGELLREFAQWWRNGAEIKDPRGQRKIYLEYVSANPTGPLHVGHGRIAAIGDTLARIFRRLGHTVHREFYVNNVGRQMNLLGESLRVRVRELQGLPGTLPEDGYRGEYLREIAAGFLREHPELPGELDPYREFAEQWILREIQEDLRSFRVEFDLYFPEEELYRQGVVAETLALLKKTPYVVEEGGALVLRSEALGDEKPRVLVRQNQEPTYFAGDVAYHRWKFLKGYDEYINLWGADHHGYAPRLYAALKALGLPWERLQILLIQFVTLLRGGQPVSMSTRAGTFTSLREVISEVGVDAARFFYLRRRNDTHLEFDLDLARAQVKENPVYYVQYAHARVASLKRKALESGAPGWEPASFSLLTAPEERELIQVLLRYPEVLLRIGETREPHELTYYLEELASAFHIFYNTHRILTASPPELAGARYALALLVGEVIAEGLSLMGVSAPESM